MIHRIGIDLGAQASCLPQSETTVARALKDRGYATACIGKWHLGRVSPHRLIDHGFDYYFGIPYSNDMRVRELRERIITAPRTFPKEIQEANSELLEAR